MQSKINLASSKPIAMTSNFFRQALPVKLCKPGACVLCKSRYPAGQRYEEKRIANGCSSFLRAANIFFFFVRISCCVQTRRKFCHLLDISHPHLAKTLCALKCALSTNSVKVECSRSEKENAITTLVVASGLLWPHSEGPTRHLHRLSFLFFFSPGHPPSILWSQVSRWTERPVRVSKRPFSLPIRKAALSCSAV